MKFRRTSDGKKRKKEKTSPKSKKRWSMRKRIIAIVVVVIVIASGVVGRFVIWPMFQEEEETQSAKTREGTVSKGDLEMTVSATGTTAGGSAYQLFELDLSGESQTGSLVVASVNATSGDTVKKGSTLLTLTKSSVDETKEILESAVKNYQTALAQSKIDYQTAINDAEADYETSRSLASTASADYQDTLATYKKNVTTLKSQFSKAQKIISTYPDKISGYQKKVTALKNNLTTVKKEITQHTKVANTVKTAYEKALKNYNTANIAYADIETVSKYMSDYSKDSSDSSITALKKSISTQLAEKKLAMTKAKKAYEAAKATNDTEQKKLTELNGKKTSYEKESDTYSDKITTARSSLSDAKKNLASYKAQYYSAVSEQAVGKVTASQTYQESMNTYSHAKTVYESAVAAAKSDLQTAKDNNTNAKKKLKAFRSLVSGTSVKASQAGTIAGFDYQVGNTLSNMTPIASYTDSSVINIPITVDQEDIHNIAVGDQVNVSLSSNPGQLTGIVSAIETSSSSESVSSVTYTVTVGVDNSSGSISSDETASVSFRTGTIEDVLYVPTSAVTEKNSKSYVTAKLTNGNTKDVEVTTGESNGQFIELKSGLQEGDIYVIKFGK